MTKPILNVVSMLMLLIYLTGCVGGGGATGSDPTTAEAASLLISLTQPEVLADNTNSTTVTITALDKQGGALSGVAVQLSASTGVLSASSGTTDDKGILVLSYRVGAQTLATSATITASSGSQTATIPITITQTGVSTVADPTTVSLAISTPTIKSDNSNTTIITLIAQDSARATLPGVPVSFQANTGLLASPASGTTDEMGRFAVTFSSGVSNLSNRVATVTAKAGTKTTSVPISIFGSTLSLTLSETSAQVGGTAIRFYATTKDAAGVSANGQRIRFSVSNPSLANISVTEALTDVTGAVPTASLTPVAAGTVTLKAAWLDDAGNETLVETREITITPTGGLDFAVTVPATSTTTLSTGQSQTVAVTVPTMLNSATVTSVRFASSAGTWAGTPSRTLTPTANSASTSFTAPNNAGIVSIQIDALGGTKVLATKKLTFAVTASIASSLSFQTSAASIVPTVGGSNSQAALTAKVRDNSGNAVGGAAVEFRLLDTTGSGESIDPPIAYSAATGSLGEAVATFTAGSRTTEGPIFIRANVSGQTCTGKLAAKYLDETNSMCKTISMSVARTAVNVTLGTSTEIADAVDKTMYDWKLSVLVVDANGSPAPDAAVSLTAFPKNYRNGTMMGSKGCPVQKSTTDVTVPTWLSNEDQNRNALLDTGEDINGNGRISPPQAAGGAITSTVITDAFGSASATLRFPKRAARFVQTEITARVAVSGSEGTTSTLETLPMSKTDAEAESCPLAGVVEY